MPAWITYRSGDWHIPSQSSLSPWYDGGTQSSYSRSPGYLSNTLIDTVVISGGHVVTITQDTIVGNSGNVLDYALSTYGAGGNGVLNVSGAVISVESYVKQGNATWNIVSTLSRSAGISFVSPSSLVWQVADANSQANAKLNIIGLTGNRCLIQSTGVANGRFTCGSNYTISQIYAENADFNRIGNASNNALYMNVGAGTSSIFLLRGCNFDNCGAISTQTFQATNTIFVVDGCKTTNSLQSYCFRHSSYTSVIGALGQRQLTNNSFDKSFSNCVFKDFTVYGNFINGRPGFLTTGAPFKWSLFANNLIIDTDAINWPGDCLSTNDWNYIHIHALGTRKTNYHGPAFTLQEDITFEGVIFDPGNTDGAGDIISPTAGNGKINIIQHILVLPNASGHQVGKLVGIGGMGRSLLSVNHCTNISNNQVETSLVQWGETYRAFPSGCNSLRSNLSFGSSQWGSGCHVQKMTTGNGAGTILIASGNIMVTGTSTTFTTSLSPGDFIVVGNGTVWDAKAYQIQAINSNTELVLFNPYDGGYGGTGRNYRPFVQDFIASSSYIACNYNAGWNLADGSDGYGYNSDLSAQKIFSYTPGPNDIILNNNPFYDSSRNIASWAISKGVATTGNSYDIQVSSAYEYIKASPSGRIYDLVNWVKQGWSVTDPLLKDAGHDGVTIGALPFIETDSSTVSYQTILFNTGFGTYLIKVPN